MVAPAVATAAANDAPKHRVPSPPLIVLAGWVLPGLGYWLLGQRARATVVGVTIITLFLSGMLLGGVRAIQVPAYGEGGGKLYTVSGSGVQEEQPDEQDPSHNWVATDFRGLLAEIGNKPWSICQVMTGPIALGSGAVSVWASRPVKLENGKWGDPPGVLSHSRINEIAVLYTAVAGMLNLLVIIDAAGRADDMRATSRGKRGGGSPAFQVPRTSTPDAARGR